MSHLNDVVKLHTDLTMLIMHVKQTDISDVDAKWSGVVKNLEAAGAALGKYLNVLEYDELDEYVQ